MALSLKLGKIVYGYLLTMGTRRLWSPVAADSAGVQASPVGPVSPHTTMGTCLLIGLNMPLKISKQANTFIINDAVTQGQSWFIQSPSRQINHILKGFKSFSRDFTG